MRALFKVPVVALILAFLAPNVGVVRVAVHGQSLPRLFEAPSPNAHASKRAVKAHQVRKARLRLELLDTPEFTLNLFDNAERVVRKTKVDRPANDRFVWHGRTDDGGIVSFAVVKGVATGTVFLDGRTFEVTSDGKGDYDIAELNPAAFPTEDAPLDRLDLQADAPGSGTVSAAAASADGTVEIDVMVLWTPAARNAVGGSQSAIESLVLSAVANANLTYTNSQGNARLRLVHSGEVAFTEAGIQTDLYVAHDQRRWDARQRSFASTAVRRGHRHASRRRVRGPGLLRHRVPDAVAEHIVCPLRLQRRGSVVRRGQPQLRSRSRAQSGASA